MEQRESSAGCRRSSLSAARHPAWLAAMLGMLLLGLAVMGWGLHDKLSLYTPPNVPPVSAKAKLLSEQERPNGTVAAAALSEPACEPAAPVATLHAIAMVSLLMTAPRAARPALASMSAAVSRPPLLLQAGNTARRPPPARA